MRWTKKITILSAALTFGLVLVISQQIAIFYASDHEEFDENEYNAELIAKSRLANPSVPETVIENFQSGHGWTHSGDGTQSDDISDFVRGTQSLKVVTYGNNIRSISTSPILSPTLDMTNKQFAIYVKIDNKNDIGLFRFEASSNNFDSDWFSWKMERDSKQLFDPNLWQRITFTWNQDYRNGLTTGTPDITSINALRIEFTGKTSQVVTMRINGITTFDTTPDEGIIVLSFDDSYDTDYNVAMKKMSNYGFLGTSYIIPNSIGLPGRLSMNQLHEMQDIHGWDISGHHETSMFPLSHDQRNEILQEVKQFLVDNGFVQGAGNYAYQGGAWNADILELTRKYFISARTIADTDETIPPQDYYRLRALLVQKNVSPQNLLSAAENTRTDKSLIIFIFHKIVATPSDNVEYSIDNFNAFIDGLHERGIKPQTMSEAIKRMM